MVRWLMCVALAAATLVGCRTGQSVTVDNGTLVPSECASPHVQRLITYCASPQAADLAQRNAELMGKKGGNLDVPYSPVPIGDSPVRGPENAPVTIVMFTDLECPYCRELHNTVNTLQAESPQDLRVVFKHTPLAFHALAVPAALGALAAREQGKFWEYVDAVYGAQDSMSKDSILAHAATLGLDLEQFRNDFGSAPHVASIEADLGLAAQAGVEGTPTMFVNGIRVVGVHPIDALRGLVASQKEYVARLADAGVPPNDLYWRLVSTQYQAAERSDIDDPQVPDEPADVVALVPIGAAPVKGAAADVALVTIVEFSDFQCPYCASALKVIDAVLADGAADTRVAFRHFPLGNHPQAGPAALAALAAQDAGKFWPYHDLLFGNQGDLSNAALVAHAVSLGIPAKDVEAAFKNAERQSRVIADQKLGIDLGIQGTPTFFVNGVMMMGIESVEQFVEFVAEQRALARAVQLKTGLKGEELYAAIVARNQKDRAP